MAKLGRLILCKFSQLVPHFSQYFEQNIQQLFLKKFNITETLGPRSYFWPKVDMILPDTTCQLSFGFPQRRLSFIQNSEKNTLDNQF